MKIRKKLNFVIFIFLNINSLATVESAGPAGEYHGIRYTRCQANILKAKGLYIPDEYIDDEMHATSLTLSNDEKLLFVTY